ncbi:uncharacterized protein LOC135474701 isoform X2 [Liolophura sinensis]
MDTTPKRVAVIGAGSAGLCALRHYSSRPEDFSVVAFEQTDTVGGTWVYTDQVGTDRFGLPVHSSMYKSLRTNIPKEVMAFPDFPFREELPSFIKHSEVLEYLQEYGKHYNLEQYIKFNTCVEEVKPIQEKNCFKHWRLTYRNLLDTSSPLHTEEFDSVMVCNGHYSTPLLPDLPGSADFRGLVMHSHDFREADPFQDMTVVCLGAASSGLDISIEISKVAKKVLLSHNKPLVESEMPSNLEQVTGIDHLEQNAVVFKDGRRVVADAIVYCTGYKFSFPFLSKQCGLEIKDERITPLYKHMIHTTFPTLFFIGMCKIICPFPQFHCQILVTMAILEGSVQLPCKEEMDADTEADFQRRLGEGLPIRHAHLMGKRQWSYNDELAVIGHFQPIDKSLQNLYNHVHATRVKDLMNYKKICYELTDSENFRVVGSV